MKSNENILIGPNLVDACAPSRMPMCQSFEREERKFGKSYFKLKRKKKKQSRLVERNSWSHSYVVLFKEFIQSDRIDVLTSTSQIWLP